MYPEKHLKHERGSVETWLEIGTSQRILFHGYSKPSSCFLVIIEKVVFPISSDIFGMLKKWLKNNEGVNEMVDLGVLNSMPFSRSEKPLNVEPFSCFSCFCCFRVPRETYPLKVVFNTGNVCIF